MLPWLPRARYRFAHDPLLTERVCHALQPWLRREGVLALMSTDECIEWDGPRTQKGYGWVRRHVYAHRDAWAKAHGPIPKGLEVRHKCDNPPCINIEHLEIGTRADNMRDMMERGRSTKKEFCKRGHRMAGDNLLFTKPTRGRNYPARYCRECNRAASERFRALHCA